MGEWQLVSRPPARRTVARGLASRPHPPGGSREPDPSTRAPTRTQAQRIYDSAKAEAYTDLVKAWWSTSRHGARLTFARLRRTNAYLYRELLEELDVTKSAAGYKLANPPDEATRLMAQEGLI